MKADHVVAINRWGNLANQGIRALNEIALRAAPATSRDRLADEVIATRELLRGAVAALTQTLAIGARRTGLIAKGNTHSDGVKLADYLTKGGPGERAELLDMRGLGVHGDAIAGFREQAELAGQTKADKPFFHVQMRGAAGELQKLSRAQILDIVNGCDRVLSRAMTQQPRIASLHIDKATGDFHIHVAYSLVARAEDGRFFVQRLGKYENKLLHYARELELKYDLRILSNERNPGATGARRTATS